jgi:hypothetical protein
VEPIAAFLAECRVLTPDQFARRHPYPFLVHSSLTGGNMKPLDETRGLTVDRLVVPEGNASPARALASITDTFTVYPLQPKNGPVPTLSLGISSACDVQVNDSSISKVHAYFSLTGEKAFVRDNDSTSGTTVNGEPVTSGWKAVGSGDRITLGFVDLILLWPHEFQEFVRTMCGR